MRRHRAVRCGCSAFTPAATRSWSGWRRSFSDAGYTVKVLDADKVPTRQRSMDCRQRPWRGRDHLAPQPIRTGLTLFDAAGNHNFSSLIFYETGYDIFTLRQASGRSWRIGQKHPCRVYFLYYQETMQARAMDLMAKKLDASLTLEGQFSSEGLAAMCADTGSVTMELARSLVENVNFGDAERGLGQAQHEQAGTVARRRRQRLLWLDHNCK